MLARTSTPLPNHNVGARFFYGARAHSLAQPRVGFFGCCFFALGCSLYGDGGLPVAPVCVYCNNTATVCAPAV